MAGGHRAPDPKMSGDVFCFRCAGWPCRCPDGITLICGDARKVLPQLPPADVCLTDPPYGLRRPSQRTGKRADIQGNEKHDARWLKLLRLTTPSAVYCFCTWDSLERWRLSLQKAGLRTRSCVVWDKGIHGLADPTTCWAPQHELVLFGAQGRYKLGPKRPADVIRVQRTNDTDHPYEKPRELMTRILEASPGELIVDPFCGTGPVLRAAKELGRRAIGVEIEAKHCRTAVDLLRERWLF